MGGDLGVVTDSTITEIYILPTSSEVISPQSPFLNSKKSKNGKATITPVLYSNQSIRLESLKEDVSSTIYTICAFEYYQEFNYSSAIKLFTSVKNYQEDSVILFYIGNCFYYQGKLNESLHYFEKTIEIEPNNSGTWNNKGIVLYMLGDYEQSLEAYEKATEINPNYSDAWNNKGVVLFDLSDYETALEAYEKAIEINPNYPEAWNNKGLALCNIGDYENASEAYEKAI